MAARLQQPRRMAHSHRWGNLVRHGLLGTGLVATAAGPAGAECMEHAEQTVALVVGLDLSPKASLLGGIEARRCVSDGVEVMARFEVGGDAPRLIGGARAYPMHDSDGDTERQVGLEAGLLLDFQQRFGAHLGVTYGYNALYFGFQGAFPLGGPERPVRTAIVGGLAPWSLEQERDAVGRPLVTDAGMLRPAFAAPLPWIASREDRAARDYFAFTAQLEYSSVWTFLRLAAELAAVGAPAALVAAALDAADDEVRHAELCAAAAGQVTLLPLAMSAAQPRFTARTPAALARLAVEAWCEGCLNEGGAAEQAHLASREATDPARAAMLATIALDERGHAELSWRVLAWLFEVAPDVTSDALADLPAPPQGAADVDDPALVRHGVPSARMAMHARAFAASTAHARLHTLRA